MCYDIKAKLESQLQYAKRFGDEAAIEELEKQLEPFWEGDKHVVSGFAHPTLLIHRMEHPSVPQFAQWGLIPFWAKDQELARKLSNSGINARGETIFEKPMFRKAARYGRAITFIDGFYEHHHVAGKKVPFYIQRKDMKPLCLALICDSWTNPASEQETPGFAIVTTEGNSMLEKIHNNPKLSGPRMPVILENNRIEDWLQPVESKADQGLVESVIRPLDEGILKAHPVHPIRGKAALGNVPEATDPVEVEELSDEVRELISD
jgi:putative SOS response-associated peptidase YedK